MSDDSRNAQVDFASYAAGGSREEETLGEVAWWVSGGMSLLAWTGIALLLTSA